MELKFDKKTGRTLCIIGLFVVVTYLLVREVSALHVRSVFNYVWGLLSPFIIGGAIAFAFNVPMRFVESKLHFIKNEKLLRVLSICLTLFFVIALIAAVLLLLVPQIKLAVMQFGKQLPGFFDKVNEELLHLFDKYPPLRDFVGLDDIVDGIDWMKLVENLMAKFETSLSTLFDSAISLVGGVVSGLYSGFFSVIFACYCLARKETLARQGRKLLYSVVSEKRADETIRVLRMSNSVFSNFITGQCLDAVLLGLMCAAVMAILRMPYIVLICVIIVITALIPVVGALVGCAVGAFLIFVSSPMQALVFIIMFIVIQQIDNNVCYPRVVGESIGLPGMWVLVAVLMGQNMMGVLGMILMVPFASVLYTLLREFAHKRLQERNVPPEKLQCQPPDLQRHFVFRRINQRKQKKQQSNTQGNAVEEKEE